MHWVTARSFPPPLLLSDFHWNTIFQVNAPVCLQRSGAKDAWNPRVKFSTGKGVSFQCSGKNIRVFSFFLPASSRFGMWGSRETCQCLKGNWTCLVESARTKLRTGNACTILSSPARKTWDYMNQHTVLPLSSREQQSGILRFYSIDHLAFLSCTRFASNVSISHLRALPVVHRSQNWMKGSNVVQDAGLFISNVCVCHQLTAAKVFPATQTSWEFGHIDTHWICSHISTRIFVRTRWKVLQHRLLLPLGIFSAGIVADSNIFSVYCIPWNPGWPALHSAKEHSTLPIEMFQLHAGLVEKFPLF